MKKKKESEMHFVFTYSVSTKELTNLLKHIHVFLLYIIVTMSCDMIEIDKLRTKLQQISINISFKHKLPLAVSVPSVRVIPHRRQIHLHESVVPCNVFIHDFIPWA